jgi:TPR repeat protein
MRNDALDNQPVFSSVDEMVEHFTEGAEILAVCPAKVAEDTSRLRLIVLTAVLVSIAALVQWVGARVFGFFLGSVLTETGLAIFVFAGLGYGVYRLFRPKTDIFIVTDRGVVGLKGTARTVHGVSASQLLSIPADRIGKYRFSQIVFPYTILRFEERDSHDVVIASQNRFWNKKHLVGPHGRSLRDALSLLRLRGSSDPGASWGTQASFVPVYLKSLWIFGAVASAFIAVFVLFTPLMGPGAEETARQGMEAYEGERFVEAAELFESAANDGNPTAQAYLGQMYEFGLGVAPDLGEARRWYEPAAEQGNAMAQGGLGYLLIFGPPGVSGDTAQGMRWLRSAAEQNDARAQNNLGAALTMTEEYSQARQFFRQAADQGYMMAQRNLGDLYFHGRGGSQSYPDALSWYRRAAEQGDAVSQRVVGFIYDQGLSVPASDDDAMLWYERAAAQGDTIARNNARILEQQRPAWEAIRELELETRPSLLDDGSQVLRLRNVRPVRLAFDLTCYRGSFSKTLSVDVAPLGFEEVGFLEGWTGNFLTGDRCEIYFAGALLQSFSIR